MRPLCRQAIEYLVRGMPSSPGEIVVISETRDIRGSL